MTADHWVRFRTGKLAIAKQPMPFKTTIQQPLTDFEDHFTENKFSSPLNNNLSLLQLLHLHY